MWDICCPEINPDNDVITKELIYKHLLWNKIVLHVCRPKLQYLCLAQIRQSTFLCNILHTDFNKWQQTFQAVQAKVGLTLPKELCWKSEHQISCYLIGEWWWGISGKNVSNKHLLISVGSERVNQSIKVVHYSIPSWKFVWHSMQYVKLYQLCNTFQFMSKPPNIPHLWPAVYTEALLIYLGHLNPFHWEHKHIFTFYVITPHWYDTWT